MITENEKEEIYKWCFNDTTQCFHFPELKKLVFLCMDEAIKKTHERDIRESEEETIID